MYRNYIRSVTSNFQVDVLTIATISKNAASAQPAGNSVLMASLALLNQKELSSLAPQLDSMFPSINASLLAIPVTLFNLLSMVCLSQNAVAHTSLIPPPLCSTIFSLVALTHVELLSITAPMENSYLGRFSKIKHIKLGVKLFLKPIK